MSEPRQKTPGRDVAYKAATRNGDYETVRQLGRMESGVGREESEYAVRGLKNRWQAKRKNSRMKSKRSKGRE